MVASNKNILTVLFIACAFLVALSYLIFSYIVFISLVIAIPIILAIIINPRFGFYLFLLTFSTETVNVFFMDSIYVSKYPLYVFVLGFLLIGTAFAFNPRNQWHFMKNPLSVVAALLFFFEMQGLLWSPNAAFGFHNVIIFTVNIIIFYLLIQYGAKSESIDAFFDVLIVSGLVTGAFLYLTMYYDGIEKVFISKDLGYSYGLLKDNNRLAGLGGVNQTGGYLSAMVFISIAMTLKAAGRLKKAYYAFTGVFMAVAMFMTTSRGTIIGFAAGIISFILLHEKGRVRFITLSAAFVIAIPALMLIAKPQFVDRLLVGFGYEGELLFSEAKRSTSTSSKFESTGMDVRIDWWKTGLRKMVERPHKLLFGLGPGGFVYYTQSPEVHSFFLAMFFDIGIFGIMLFLIAFYMLMAMLVRCFKAVDRASPQYIILIATSAIVIGEVCVHGLIEYEFTSMIGRYPWFYLALNIVAANAVLKQAKAREGGAGPVCVVGSANL